jgi:hypothetical protein
LAYPIFSAALASYGRRAPAEHEYAEGIRQTAVYPGTEFWGAFHGDDMAAFATCRTLDGAVELISAKSDPRLHKFEPNSALFYTMCKDYLADGALAYVSNGSRTLWHPTTINTFLEKLGFRKVYCRVNVELSAPARAIDLMGPARWGGRLGFDKLFGDRWAQLEGFGRLMTIAGTFK